VVSDDKKKLKTCLRKHWTWNAEIRRHDDNKWVRREKGRM